MQSLTSLSDYQLALVMPGIRACDAISRKQRRETWNFRRKPRDLPVNLQRFLSLIGDEFFGNLSRAMRAFSLSSSEAFRSKTTFLNCWRLSQCSLTSTSRFFCFATDDFFAILVSPIFLWVTFYERVPFDAACGWGLSC